MIVSHYSTYGAGGAFVLMSRLHHQLREHGVDSRIRLRSGRSGNSEAVQIEYCGSWLDRQLESIRYRFENRVRKSDAPSYFSRLKVHRATRPHPDDLKADIVHLHWVGRWLDLPSFLSSVPDTIPIVWTIHDMNPLAGGCFTYSGCDAFEDGCRRCPLLKSPFDRFVAANEFRRRLNALKNRRIHLVGNSCFTTSLAEKSGLFRHAESISTILPSLNPSNFVEHDKHKAKMLLGIPEDHLVLGFGAAVLTDENKGYIRFADVAARVASAIPNVHVLLFGDGPAANVPGATMQSLGAVSSSALQSLVYSAMDVFVVTSRMETFGQVAIEAQSCGTPVWAFAVGGLSDAILDGVTGRLVPFEECDTMAASILTAYNRLELEQMGQKGRKWVSESFTTDEMAKKYIAVYNRALGRIIK